MTEYKQKRADGRVYKIVCSDGLVYVGSTFQSLAQRLGGHRRLAKNNRPGKLYDHLRQIGIKNCKIILLETLENKTKEELIAREDYYITLLRVNVTMEQHRQAVLKQAKDLLDSIGVNIDLPTE